MVDISVNIAPITRKEKITLDDEWFSFIQTGKEPHYIRSNILASWKRCRAWGIDPYLRKTNKVMEGEKLQQRLREKYPLLQVVKPYMQNIYNIVEGSGFIIFLSDNDATVLHVVGEEKVLEEYKSDSNFQVGANWSEDCVGTTAVNMVLKEERPIQISGKEHYCYEQRKWTCSGVPIKDASGKPLAVLSMAGRSEQFHLHTLGMLVAAEMAIENQLQVMEASEKMMLTARYHRAVMDAVTEGILSIDRNGIITYMNKSASKILLYDAKKAIGKHVTEIVDFRPVILDVLNAGKGYKNKEFIINSKRGRLHFVKSAIPIVDENGEIDGVVDVFREIKEIKSLVNQMVGAQAQFDLTDIVGESKEILEAKRQAVTAAHCFSNVLLMGESGTGKELFAQAIHNESSRACGPFIAVNCGAVPRDLIEAEFFGYEEGAFTGARQGGRPGKFEMAAGGTIFLDEIGEMPIDMQVKLLRVLQEKRVTRVGGNKTIPVDVRVIAATNKQLRREMEEGTFRKDLFWRLNVITINIPPLHQRKGDVLLLAGYFLRKYVKEDGVCRLDEKTSEILENYSWPGNVRELENALERAVIFAENQVILPEHLPKNILNNHKKRISMYYHFGTLKQVEEEAIREVLEFCRGNISQAANLLGIARNTLYCKMRNYGIKC